MSMNQEAKPAYLVYHNNQIDKPTHTLFTDPSLLTARKAAMAFAESLFGCPIEFGADDVIEVNLVETATEPDSEPMVIAKVLKRRSHAEGRSKECCKEVLRELQHELAYYQTHNHPWGFGRFVLRVELDPRPKPEFQATVLFDAVNYALVAIGSAGPQEQCFDVTYDARDEPAQLLDPA